MMRKKKRNYYTQNGHDLSQMMAKKVSIGLLPLHILEPGWLMDPTHWTKVVSKRFFDI
jgi:hypothetical protein